MKVSLIVFSILFNSCIQSTNSNSFDRSFSETIDIDRSGPAGESLFQAYNVLKKNCMSCHTGYHNDWNAFNTDQAWINSGVIEPNDAYASSLVIRLKNTGGNMPKNSPQITEDELTIISTW
ncbi:MAG: hypothetical protein OEW87_15400, partial [Flavobacteriaceae bacterium]|nr:hypothetical protein [Flavobacteriaceae bacterium]